MLEDVEVKEEHVDSLLEDGLTKRSLTRFEKERNAFEEEFPHIPRSIRRNIIDAWRELFDDKASQQQQPRNEPKPSDVRKRSQSPVTSKNDARSYSADEVSPSHQQQERSNLCRRDLSEGKWSSPTKFGEQPVEYLKSSTKEHKVDNNVSKFNLPELFRAFDTDENCTYARHCLLLPETGPDDLLNPCHEYKAFQSQTSTTITKQINFMKYLIKFTCACLNERTNGTIHYGVADDIEKDQCGNPKFKHGEILGVPLSEKDRQNFYDWTQEAINKCFKVCCSNGKTVPSSECQISNCIRRPKFIPVTTNENNLYVVEIDIVPKSLVCTGYHFKVSAPKTAGKSGRINFSEGKYQVYRRVGSSSEPIIKKEHVSSFIRNEVPKLDALRKEIEETRSYKKIQRGALLDNEKKLTNFILNGHRSIDDVYSVLVCGRPDDETDATKDLSFVAQLDCTVVFDFDADSEKDGLSKVCSSSFNQRKIKKFIRLYDIDNDVFTSNCTTDKFCENLNFKKDVVWVYPNGHSKYDSTGNCAQPDTAMSLPEWTEKRSRKMGDATYMLSNTSVIPEGRASIMCIIMHSDPQQMQIMCECIHNLIVRFKMERVFFLIKNERVKEMFFCHIGAGGRYSKSNLEERTIVGMPWLQVNRAIAHLRGYLPSNDCVVRYSNGGLCEIDIDTQRRLENCAIVSVKQCSDKNLQNDKQFRQQEEENFFNGERVSWWNFFFPGQVCRRDLVNEYRFEIYEATFQQLEEYVHLIKLRHERGAGGTTVARNLLWDLRKHFRCVEITGLDKEATYETAEQIVQIFLYEEEDPSKCLPVFALLDLDCEEEIVNELKNDLEELFHQKGARTPACILLHCLSQYKADESDLKQKLSDGELMWFENKEQEMKQSKTQTDSGLQKLGFTVVKSLNTMLGFQVLRNNFNYDRIIAIVCGLVENTTSQEKDLLRFLALIHMYVNECIPLPCCDNMMGLHWQNQMSKEFEQLTVWYRGTSSPNQRIVSSVTYLTTSHYFVSKALLEREKLSQVTSKFLESPLLKSGSHSRKILCQSTTTMMKQRKETTDKQNLLPSKQQFSDLITDIMDREKPLMAADILQDCFDILSRNFYADPMLLQQAARVYYLKMFDFDEALNLAEKAISYNRTNSYLLDTKAQVFKEQLRHDFPTSHTGYWSVKEGSQIIKLSFKALDVFHESLRAAKEEYVAASPVRRRRRLNDSGYFGSLYVAYDLLERLSQVEEFSLEVVRKYLSNPDFIPINVHSQWSKYHDRIKQVKPDINWLMEGLADRLLKANLFEETQTTIDTRNKVYNDMKNKYKKYLGVPHPLKLGSQTATQLIPDACEERRHKIRATAITVDSKTGEQIYDNRSSAKVLGFANVFDLFQWFWIYYGKNGESHFAISHLNEAKQELKLNTPKSKYDLQMLIYINLLLANFEIKGTETNEFCKETFSYCKEYFEKTREEDNLYPATLIVMLMWPRENMPVRYDNSLFLEALERVRAAHIFDTTKDSVQFYLGKGTGLQAFIHAKKLSHGSKYRLDRDRFWTQKTVQDKVCRVRGYSNQVNKILANNVCNKRESVLVHCKKALERFSQEEGTFVLGFRKTGPIAFDWQEAKRGSPMSKSSNHLAESAKRNPSKAQTARDLKL